MSLMVSSCGCALLLASCKQAAQAGHCPRVTSSGTSSAQNIQIASLIDVREVLTLASLCLLCRELGKVVTGKLVVATADRQDTFIVRGRQPAYVPPQASTLPAGTYLTATTASSRAKGGSSSSSASADGSSRSAGLQAREEKQQPAAVQGKRNYLQQNIKAAKSNKPA